MILKCTKPILIQTPASNSIGIVVVIYLNVSDDDISAQYQMKQ